MQNQRVRAHLSGSVACAQWLAARELRTAFGVLALLASFFIFEIEIVRAGPTSWIACDSFLRRRLRNLTTPRRERRVHSDRRTECSVSGPMLAPHTTMATSLPRMSSATRM